MGFRIDEDGLMSSWVRKDGWRILEGSRILTGSAVVNCWFCWYFGTKAFPSTCSASAKLPRNLGRLSVVRRGRKRPGATVAATLMARTRSAVWDIHPGIWDYRNRLLTPVSRSETRLWTDLTLEQADGLSVEWILQWGIATRDLKTWVIGGLDHIFASVSAVGPCRTSAGTRVLQEIPVADWNWHPYVHVSRNDDVIPS